MKQLITCCIILFSFLGFSQELIVEELKPEKLRYKTDFKGFQDIYNRLETISESLNETSVVFQRIDEIRQGFIVINTNSFGQSFEPLKIDARPSLNLELQRVMFSGNFFNTFQRLPIIVRQY